jgi:predicted component of type VI protein secretion system
MQAKLVFTSQEDQSSQEIPFNRPSITIGRKAGNDLHFNRAEISGNHAAFTSENNQFFVSDLGSTNGTLLNGAQLVARERYTLQHGDVVTITPFRITFLVESHTSETMIEAPKPKAPPPRKGSGTEPDLASSARKGTGTEENKKESFGPVPPPPAASAKKEAEAPAVVAPPPEPPAPAAAPKAETPVAPAAAPPAKVASEPIPEIPKKSALPDYVWLGIGAIFVIVGIGLIVLLFMMM